MPTRPHWSIPVILASLHLQAACGFVVVAPTPPNRSRKVPPLLWQAASSDDRSSIRTAVPTTTPTYQHVKGVIFDVDGTLADSWKLGYDATVAILQQHNIPVVSTETYHQGTRYATPDRLARHAGYEPGHALYESTGKLLGQQFDDLYVDLVSTKTAAFYHGIHELLQNLPSHVAVGALTNAAERYAHAVLETNCPVVARNNKENSSNSNHPECTAVYARFKSIRGADTVPKPKPAPDGLLQVCRELGLRPDECVYIGDSPSDGTSAHSAGMPAIGVLWGSHSQESLQEAPFTHLCQTVAELQALLPQNEKNQVGVGGECNN